MSFPVLGTRRLGSGAFVVLEQIHLVAPGGIPTRRDVLRHPGGVGVLPIDGGEFVFISQFRVALGRYLLEIPAGKLDHPGETLEEAAARELCEEIGAASGRLTPLGALSPSPGYTDETIHLFAATGIVPVQRQPDGLEEHYAQTVRMPFDETFRLLDAGGFLDAKTQVALMVWARRML